MKQDPNRAIQLAERLRPFLERRRNTCFSDIEGVLHDILKYLEDNSYTVTNAVADPTIRNQLDLPLEAPPKRGDIRCSF